MKWPKRYPVMRSAKQAIYMRQLCVGEMMHNIDCSYEKMEQYKEAIEKHSKFINERSVTPDQFVDVHNQYSFFRETCNWDEKDSLKSTALKCKLSIRSVKYLLKQTL